MALGVGGPTGTAAQTRVMCGKRGRLGTSGLFGVRWRPSTACSTPVRKVQSATQQIAGGDENRMSSYSPPSREEPIRLFKSDFLEYFSHISPVTVAIVWAPVALFFLWVSINRAAGPLEYAIIPVAFLLGWFIWTFFEYIIHRFIFHYHPGTERLKRFFFMMHGVHHAQPMCRTRLVMPPALSVPMSLAFYGLYYLVVVVLLEAHMWMAPIFAGSVFGYLVYDLMHYSIHHSNVKSGIFFRIRVHHLRHHGACSFLRFGVTFSFWDRVFGTLPEGSCADELQKASG